MPEKEQTPEDLETVRQRTRLAIQVLERIAGLKSKAEDLVHVGVDLGKKSFFRQTFEWEGLKEPYMIRIQQGKTQCLDNYFAEASHLIRDIKKKEEGLSQKSKWVERQVDEFYDMAGQRIGFELWKGNERLRQVLGDELYEKTRAAFMSCDSKMKQTAEAKWVAEEEFIRRFEAKGQKELRKKASSLPDAEKRYNEVNVATIQRYRKKMEPELEEGKITLAQWNETMSNLENLEPELKEAKEKMLELKEAKDDAHCHFIHRRPYAAAENATIDQYLDAPSNFYGLTDAEVKSRFFAPLTQRERRQGLEARAKSQGEAKARKPKPWWVSKYGELDLKIRAVNSALLLSTAMLLVYSSSAFSITGFSILDKLVITPVTPTIIFLLILILILAVIKLKLVKNRRDNKQ